MPRLIKKICQECIVMYSSQENVHQYLLHHGKCDICKKEDLPLANVACLDGFSYYTSTGQLANVGIGQPST